MNAKRIIALILVVVLVLAIVLSAAGCGSQKEQKSTAKTVPVADGVSHQVPEVENDGALVFGRETGFAEYLQTNAGITVPAEPLYYYDENGNVAGEYIYDENCWVHSWVDEDGKVHKLPESEQFEAIDAIQTGAAFRMAGDVKLHFFLYVEKQVPIACYRYFILTESTDMDCLLQGLAEMGMRDVQKLSDKVVLFVAQMETIEDEQAKYGDESTISGYMAYLRKHFGVNRIG